MTSPARTNRSSSIAIARRWASRLLRALLALSLLALGVMSLVGFEILRRQGDIPPMGARLQAIGAVVLGAVALLGLWWIPRRQAAALGELPARERGELTDRFRRTLGAVALGVALLLVLGKGLREATALEEGVQADRFARAAAQLASNDLVTRVAGVHSLETIGRSSEALRRPAYETLVVFVRERARLVGGDAAVQPGADVIAAATAVARRSADGDAGPLRPDFSSANLRGVVAPEARLDFARLRDAHLQTADLRGARIAGKFGADLRGAHLDSANLAGAHLDGARLTDGATLLAADLRRADLDGASMRGADLRHARLDSAELQGAGLAGARLDSASLRGALMSGATFAGASLVGTDFAGAGLRNANLARTDLRAARNLTQAQLAGARMDSTTLLPPGLTVRQTVGRVATQR
ncbi:MAG TPA: pentapeptide repeat-containing protein [Gemmatimonadaceae bacterium]|nr:pentapeptide repeat-containing protein [Gemmatimonadaceae bacterium]